jgi:hypothetical protein
LSKAVCVDRRCPRVRELPQTQNGVVAADAPVRALRRKQKVGRLVAYGPFGHWKTTTFLAALRHDRITAPSDSDGPINGAKASGNVSV